MLFVFAFSFTPLQGVRRFYGVHSIGFREKDRDRLIPSRPLFSAVEGLKSFLLNAVSASHTLSAYCNNKEIPVILIRPISSPDGFPRSDEAMPGDWPVIRVGDAEK
jgi:hypothetical protein